MDIKQIIVLALQVSIMLTVLGFGLKATPDHLLYLVRRPSLMWRSVLAVFVMMPIVALLLARLFHFRQVVEIALVALALSPMPPILPTKGMKAGGDSAYAVGLMTVLGVVSIVAIPAILKLLEAASGQPLGMSPGTIAGIVFKTTLVPLVVGVAVRAAAPSFADGLAKPVALIGKVLLVLGALPLLIVTFPAVIALIGEGTLLAMLIFALVGLGLGHYMGGPDAEHSTVLALSTASRHPAIAYGIASANYPDLSFGGAIVLYLLFSAIVTAPYVVRQRRHALGEMHPA
jgi:bile acid:Na+ symporter, BASS family